MARRMSRNAIATPPVSWSCPDHAVPPRQQSASPTSRPSHWAGSLWIGGRRFEISTSSIDNSHDQTSAKNRRDLEIWRTISARRSSRSTLLWLAGRKTISAFKASNIFSRSAITNDSSATQRLSLARTSSEHCPAMPGYMLGAARALRTLLKERTLPICVTRSVLLTLR